MLAALLALVACNDVGPGARLGDARTPEEQLAEERMRELEEVWNPRFDTLSAVYDEIRRTFTADDMEAKRWRERWPGIWGPEGWGWNISHGPDTWPVEFQSSLRHRHGPDWHKDEAAIAAARAEAKTEVDEWLLDKALARQRRDPY